MIYNIPRTVLMENDRTGEVVSSSVISSYVEAEFSAALSAGSALNISGACVIVLIIDSVGAGLLFQMLCAIDKLS